MNVTSTAVSATDLADLTTFRTGGPASRVVHVYSADELVKVVSAADEEGQPVLLVAGGSNLLISDDGFEGLVVVIRSRGLHIASEDMCSGVNFTVEAGHPWDDVVARAVTEGWVGIEALSGIPGSSGATPVQNVGAYGQEVSQTISSVRTWDRLERRQRTFAASECEFGYRWSRFKADPGRYLVLDVSFQLKHGTLSTAIRYGELARALGVEVGERAPMTEVREQVLALRAGKGMVLDPLDHDTWSAGSFFTNPVVDGSLVPEGAPRYAADGGLVKTSAAWLIENAGFAKGYGLPGPAALSTKHTLALTNRGQARSEDLIGLARVVRDGVRDRFGITLANEPVLVGLEL